MAEELVRRARERGLSLTGPDGLLKQLTKTVIETALNEEMTGHLGYAKHDPAGQGAGSANVRNGTRPKTVLTDGTGHVELDVPRDRAGTFEPQIVRKRQRRLTGVDEIVLSLYAKGLELFVLVEERTVRDVDGYEFALLSQSRREVGPPEPPVFRVVHDPMTGTVEFIQTSRWLPTGMR